MLKIFLAHVSTETINVITNDAEGLTPLHCVCRGGGGAKRSVEMARLLLEKGADIDAKTNQGQTSLMMACQANNVDLVRVLLTKLNETATNAQLDGTILSYACANSSVDVVQLLCEEFQMEIYTLNTCHWQDESFAVPCASPLEAACVAGQLDTIFYLLRDQQALSLSLSR